MINIRGIIDQMRAGKDPWPIQYKIGTKAVYSVTQTGVQNTGTAAATNTNVFSFWVPPSYNKKVTILAVTTSWNNGSGGTFSINLNHVTTDGNTGRAPLTPVKHDQRDPASGIIVRLIGISYLTPDLQYQSILVAGSSTGQFIFDFQKPNEGKPIVLYAGEGIQLSTTVLSLMTTQAGVFPSIIWMEE